MLELLFIITDISREILSGIAGTIIGIGEIVAEFIDTVWSAAMETVNTLICLFHN